MLNPVTGDDGGAHVIENFHAHDDVRMNVRGIWNAHDDGDDDHVSDFVNDCGNGCNCAVVDVSKFFRYWRIDFEINQFIVKSLSL